MPPAYVATLAINIAINVVYGILVLRDWRKQPKEIRKLQVLNTMGVIAALGFAQYFLAGYFYNMTKIYWSISFDPLPVVFSVIAIVPGAIAIVLRAIKPKTPERSQELRELAIPQPSSPQTVINRDLLRKGTHVIMFLAIFAIDLIGFYILFVIFHDPFSLIKEAASGVLMVILLPSITK